MAKRQRRSPAEIKAALEARLSKVSQRAALDGAKSNPVLLPLYNAREALNKELAVQSRGFSTGPQSFETRRTSHQLWLQEIDAAELFARAAMEQAKSSRELVDAAIIDITARLDAGETVDPQEIQDAVTFTVSPDYADAKAAFENAQALRKAFKAEAEKPAEMPMVAEANAGN